MAVLPVELGSLLLADQILHVEESVFITHFDNKDIQLGMLAGKPSLATVFPSLGREKGSITESCLKRELQRYIATDDVFRTEFLETVVFQGESEEALTDEARHFLASIGTNRIHFLPAKSKAQPGPYIIADEHLRHVWRLYKDINGAFMATFRADNTMLFEPNIMKDGNDTMSCVAVPSRLKYQSTPHLPLAGVRIAVKDNFHLKGWRTSLCNQAYYDTYPPRQATAACIERLVKLGAVIVGKTKLTSFAVWEEPTEYIDFPAPWNSRADGYQSPGGSSSGSAAAIGAYEWLDFAIGSDTCGSIMRPALWNGCFALRPSTGQVPNDGLVISIDYLDVPCFLGRDLGQFSHFIKAWYTSTPKKPQFKKFTKLIWASDFWATISKEQCVMAKEFTAELRSSLEVTQEEVSFERRWDESPPSAADGRSLQEFIVEAISNIGYDFYHAFDNFRHTYSEMENKQPYVSPPVKRNWDAASRITVAERDEAIKRIKVYRDWFNEHVLSERTDHALMVVPIENLSPRYRDEPPNFERPPLGINSLFLSPILEAPELIIPIGEILYTSRISDREEKLPFALGLVSLPGSDLMLIDTMLNFLQHVGRPTKVFTGRSMFRSESCSARHD